MILDEIVLENVGLYAGRQAITLSPTKDRRPVILIGGMNGRGKTTLLDAIQLCLYGKLASCSNRGSTAYGLYLQQTIHKYAQPKAAAVELKFRQTVDGRQVQYHLCRSWTDSSAQDVLTVSRDGVNDSFLAENWSEIVETIIPRRIASLFFFDGEKIESYASTESATQLLRTAMNNLLGMDLVDQLSSDLDLLKARKAKHVVDEDLKAKLFKAQESYEGLVTQRQAETESVADMRTHQLDDLQKRLDNVERDLARSGGDVYERRQELGEATSAVEQEVKEMEIALRHVAASEAPLLLVTDLLSSVCATADAELMAAQERQFIDKVRTRDEKILEMVAASDAKSSKKLAAFLAADIAARKEAAGLAEILGMGAQAVAIAKMMVASTLPERRSELVQRLDARENAVIRRDRLVAQVASVPAAETLESLLRQREDLKGELTKVRAVIQDRERNIEKLNTLILRAKQSLIKVTQEKVQEDFNAEDAVRTIRYATRVQETLRAFQDRTVRENLQRIQKLVLKSFRELIGKEALVKDIDIDPVSFSITLLGQRGEVVPSERLSAGERQLFAVAMLWGLAKAAGRRLPTIIDTPLGRLDSSHRANLVSRYFPRASHQVILLSTDEELAGQHLKALRESIGRSYILNYDHAQQATTVREGYFDNEVGHAA